MTKDDQATSRRDAAAKIFAESQLNERAIAIEASKDYGASTIKTLILLNGGAIVALLAFLAALYGKDAASASLAAKAMTLRLSKAFVWFGSGLTLAAATSAVGYINWFNVADSYGSPGKVMQWLEGDETLGNPPWRERLINATIAIAVAGALLSLSAFAGGAWTVFRALRRAI